MDENKELQEEVKEEVQEIAQETEEPKEEPEKVESDIDALLAIVSELQIKLNELEARVATLEAPASAEEPAPIEEPAPEAESEEVEILKSNVTMLRHQLLAVMRSNQATQPVGVPQDSEAHDPLAGSIRYSMQGLNIN